VNGHRAARRLICVTATAALLLGAVPSLLEPAGAKIDVANLPAPVAVRGTPEGVTLADPAFTPLPGARADFGRLGGAVYQIEMPNDWNGKLVLYQHGFEDLSPEARATAPDFRRYLIGQGYAWGASSFSSTSFIPGRSADETAALWDRFARTYGRPDRTYVTGLSMGGLATSIAAERYGNRYDGALALCGAASPVSASVSPGADMFVAAAFVAGVTQAEYDAGDIGRIFRERIHPALEDPAKHRQFEDIMIDITGGPRAYAREGIHIEEATDLRRAEIALPFHISRSREHYDLGPVSDVSERDFNRRAVRLRVDEDEWARFSEGVESTGDLQMPLLTLHTTGDGEVPIEQAVIRRQLVRRAGREHRLVQRVIRDPGHCGFTTEEQERAFDALVAWVEHREKPRGTDLGVRDLRTLSPTFERSPRAGSRRAGLVRGERNRVHLRGRLTLDGQPLDAQFLGAVVTRDGLETPCQGAIPDVARGRYRIPVVSEHEVLGCGRRGARIVLWTYAGEQKVFATRSLAWPGDGRTVRFDGEFASADPAGAAPPAVELAGVVYRRNGRRMPLGTRVEAFVGDTRCALSSVRRSGSFAGFVLAVVGPESVPGCTRGAMLSFRLDGRPAVETVPNSPGRRELLELTLA
jgi:pimeloyl-ACP methyl ester carboxylesterase